MIIFKELTVMYSFKRTTIDAPVYRHEDGVLVKYIGYEIPLMHGLTYTVKLNNETYECPEINDLRPPLAIHKYPKGYAITDGIWSTIKFDKCKDTICSAGYFGSIIVYDRNETVIELLEMLLNDLYSTPYYTYMSRSLGIDDDKRLRHSLRIRVRKMKGFPPDENDTWINLDKNSYNIYHVDTNQLKAFIDALKSNTLDFPVKYIRKSIATDPIKPEPVTEQPKRVTWRWSV